MGLFSNKDPYGNMSLNLLTVEDTVLQRGLKTQLAITATLLEDRVEFAERFSYEPAVCLMYNQITKVEYISSTQIQEKNKSVAGRALVGGLLLGPLGAVIGGLDGTTKKQKKEIKFYLIFNYISSSGQEESLPVEVPISTFGIEKFKKALQEKCTQLGAGNDIKNTKYL